MQLCPGTVIYQDLSQLVPWVKVIRRSEEDGDLTVLLTWRDGPGQNTLAGMYLYCNKLKLVTYNFGIKYQMVNLFYILMLSKSLHDYASTFRYLVMVKNHYG